MPTSDPDGEPIPGVYPPGMRTTMGMCLAADCEHPAHTVYESRECGCSWSQVTCLLGHRTTVTVLMHQGAHAQEAS